ncbi:conserved hypothetical protein [Candidatus Desulfosporosinus infrequens]|uniref:Asp23/Gls24 family envelope stress response protein n=1 Tax=Candidatus Desulfosporosinus infrequens TaxID=2043169 RepID=A0A2U3KA31_9FIRM|nr:conserved hypothetical protein [Candidatus Desulfosporosinus infrequens]
MQEVFAFVGPSGSGKSYHAIELASDLNTDIIIDDGLLITISGRIAGGISSKLQLTKVGAIKAALFTDDNHQKEAIKILNDLNPRAILILGTSNKMVEKIVKRLNLVSIYKFINIIDIVDSKQIRTANYFRKQLGKHIIPAPTIEVTRTFPNIIIEAIQTLLKRKKSLNPRLLEQTIIRPHFSYLGRIIIANRAIEDLVRGMLRYYTDIAKINNIKIKCEAGNAILSIHLDLIFGVKISQYVQTIQRNLKEGIEKCTDFNIVSLDVTIDDLEFRKTP